MQGLRRRGQDKGSHGVIAAFAKAELQKPPRFSAHTPPLLRRTSKHFQERLKSHPKDRRECPTLCEMPIPLRTQRNAPKRREQRGIGRIKTSGPNIRSQIGRLHEQLCGKPHTPLGGRPIGSPIAYRRLPLCGEIEIDRRHASSAEAIKGSIRRRDYCQGPRFWRDWPASTRADHPQGHSPERPSWRQAPRPSRA